MIKTTNLLALASIVFAPMASAALTLTVNTTNQTLTWTGSATSSAIPLAFLENGFLILGTKQPITNVNGRVPSTVESQPGLSVDIDTTLPGDNSQGFINADSPGQIYVDERAGNEFVASFVANYLAISPDHTATVTLTGNGIPYQYVVPGNVNSSLEQAQIDFLTSLDGTEIFFQNNNAALAGNTYGSAGFISIVTVPEPSSSLLVSLGFVGLIIRRSRCCS